jgi:hypothetical protein
LKKSQPDSSLIISRNVWKTIRSTTSITTQSTPRISSGEASCGSCLWPVCCWGIRDSRQITTKLMLRRNSNLPTPWGRCSSSCCSDSSPSKRRRKASNSASQTI